MHSKNQKRHSSPGPSSRVPLVPMKPKAPAPPVVPGPGPSSGDTPAFRVPHSRFNKAPLAVYPPKGARNKSCVSLPVVALEKMPCLSRVDGASRVRLTTSSSSSSSASPSSLKPSSSSSSPLTPPAPHRSGEKLLNGRAAGVFGVPSSSCSVPRSATPPSSQDSRPSPARSPLDRRAPSTPPTASPLDRRPPPSPSSSSQRAGATPSCLQLPMPSSVSTASPSSSSSSNSGSLADRKQQNGAKASSSSSSSSSRPHRRLSGRVFDPDKHCGVQDPESKRSCTRSLTCKTHSLTHRRAVPGRGTPFDSLLAEHKGRAKEKVSLGVSPKEKEDAPAAVSQETTSPSRPHCPNGRPLSTLKLRLANAHIPRVPGLISSSAAQPAPASASSNPEPSPHGWGRTAPAPASSNPEPSPHGWGRTAPAPASSNPDPSPHGWGRTAPSAPASSSNPEPSPHGWGRTAPAPASSSNPEPSPHGWGRTAPASASSNPEPSPHGWGRPAGDNSRLSSDDGDVETSDDAADRPACHFSTHHPRPLACCVFSSRLMGRGHYVFDRRWDRMRLALQSMVERHLNAQMWRKVPLAAESLLSLSSSVSPSATSLAPLLPSPTPAEPFSSLSPNGRSASSAGGGVLATRGPSAPVSASRGNPRNGTAGANAPGPGRPPAREREDSAADAKKRRPAAAAYPSSPSLSSSSSSSPNVDGHKRNGGSDHPAFPPQGRGGSAAGLARRKGPGGRVGSYPGSRGEAWLSRTDGGQSHSLEHPSSTTTTSAPFSPSKDQTSSTHNPSGGGLDGKKRRSPSSYGGRTSKLSRAGGLESLFRKGNGTGSILASGPDSPRQASLTPACSI